MLAGNIMKNSLGLPKVGSSGALFSSSFFWTGAITGTALTGFTFIESPRVGNYSAVFTILFLGTNSVDAVLRVVAFPSVAGVDPG